MWIVVALILFINIASFNSVGAILNSVGAWVLWCMEYLSGRIIPYIVIGVSPMWARALNHASLAGSGGMIIGSRCWARRSIRR